MTDLKVGDPATIKRQRNTLYHGPDGHVYTQVRIVRLTKAQIVVQSSTDGESRFHRETLVEIGGSSPTKSTLLVDPAKILQAFAEQRAWNERRALESRTILAFERLRARFGDPSGLRRQSEHDLKALTAFVNTLLGEPP